MFSLCHECFNILKLTKYSKELIKLLENLKYVELGAKASVMSLSFCQRAIIFIDKTIPNIADNLPDGKLPAMFGKLSA